MSWLGIGLVSRSSSPIGGLDDAFKPPIAVSPGPMWTGTAGSGFATLPVDPDRVTAKPACRLIVPMNQHFTDSLDVGVIAMANDGGTLINNFGVKQVRFLFEGGVAVVPAPRWHTIATERGPRTYFGWWARLRKPPQRQGKAVLYVEAEAHDTTMQKRVIGPFNFCPTDTVYDLDLEVNPDLSVVDGSRFQTLFDAASYARSRGAHNPRFLITKAGKYELTADSSVTIALPAWDITGRYTIEASVPGVSIGRNTYTNDDDAVLPSLQAYWRLKGANITFDSFHVRLWGARSNAGFADDPGHWLDGVTVTTTSPDGKDDMMRGGGYARNGSLVTGWTSFTECDFVNQNTPANSSGLVRGCYFLNSSQDLVAGARCVVFSTFEHSDQQFWNSDAAAFTVVVPTGATLERAGGNSGSGAGGGVWTATIGGTPYTFDVGNGSEEYFLGTATYRGVSGIGGYWTADVVDWLNSLPGFSATLSPEFAADDRRASFLSRPGRKGQGFDVARRTQIIGDGATAFPIVWCVDTHGDFYQHRTGIIENVIIAFNRAWDLEVQAIFLAPILLNGTAATRDVFFVGNAFAIQPENGVYYDPNTIASQIGRSQDVSHVVIAHNTFANQRFIASFTAGGPRDLGYNLIKNNAFRAFAWNSGVVPPGVTVDGLLIHAGQTIPVGTTNYIVAGDANSLFVDAFNGDFTPTPMLQEFGLQPAIPFDFNRQPFPTPCTVGAVAAEAVRLIDVEPEPDTGYVLGPAGKALADALSQRIHGGMWVLGTASNPGLWSAVNFSGSAGSFVQGNAEMQPIINPATGSVFSGNDQISCTLYEGDYTFYVLLRKDESSTNGHIVPNEIIYASGSTARAAAQAGVQVSIDGSLSPTRGSTFTALDQRQGGATSFRVVKVEGLYASTFALGRAAGSAFTGAIKAIAAVPEFGFDDPDSDGPTLNEMQLLADAWMAEQKDNFSS